MKKLLPILLAILVLSSVSCGEGRTLPKLDGSFTGYGFTINFPKTYKVEERNDGIIIHGNFNINLKVSKNASIKIGSVYQLLLAIQKRDKEAKLELTHITTKVSGFDAVQAEGFDSSKQYTYTIYVPVDGGLFILSQEPAYLNEPLMNLSHLIARSWEIKDPGYFVGK